MATRHQSRTRFRPTPRRVALACLALAAPGWAAAQGAPQLEPVTVTGRAAPTAGVAGWGTVPIELLPLQATVLGSERLRDTGGSRLADLGRIDASVGDAYNTTGYWDYLTVRGFVLDNRSNYRRDGLPISAETSIPLDNKEQLVVLKGTSGLQAGTSAPGGLVDLVVKRPLERSLRRAGLEWKERGTVTGTLDLSERFGADRAFGLRLNAAAAHLDPKVDDAQGRRHLLALAGDWRLAPDTLLEAEFETSRLRQPSVPGFSLRGADVPAPVDPRININNQVWSLPGVFDADTASLRWTQKLAAGWTATLHAATQRLRSDDRIAFPFGCSNDPAGYQDHGYCSDGSLDLFDYRSENERRRTDALDASLRGELLLGGLRHRLSAGVLFSRARLRFQDQAYNYAGAAQDDGSVRDTVADPTLAYASINRDERSTEWYLRDAITLGEGWTAWVGLRHTALRRKTFSTQAADGSVGDDYAHRFVTPFAALSYAVAPGQLLHLSWGEGVESSVAPRLPTYSNAGSSFAAKSRQAEVGWRGQRGALGWNAALFDITRPRYEAVGRCADESATACLTYRRDGTQHHRGLEAQLDWSTGAWTLQAGAQWLRARIEDSVANPALNSAPPANVPARTLKGSVEHRLAAVPGLSLQAGLVHESERRVLPGTGLTIPGWTRLDTSARYDTRIVGQAISWRVGVDNLTDKRAWRESPYQFGHVYLFPLAARTLRIGVQVDL